MENASKALLIGGAVLIAIVLISIGVYIISSQQGVIDSSKKASDVLAVKTFNSTFEKYVGTRKGSEIKNLCIDVRTSNSQNTNHQVKITVGSNDYTASTEISNYQSTVNVYGNYTVTVSGEDEDGYITALTIQ